TAPTGTSTLSLHDALPIWVAQNRFVDLHVLGGANRGVMGLKQGWVFVVVVAFYGAGRGELSRLEQQATAGIANADAQPDAPRRIGCGELVPSQVFDHDLGLESSTLALQSGERHARRVFLQKRPRARNGRAELERRGGDAQLGAVPAQHAEYEEVGAAKVVARDLGPQRPHDRSDRRWRLHHRHVARLAAVAGSELAVQPFLVRHLLGQLTDDPA